MIEETIERWRGPLLRFCTQVLRHEHDAEEVVQDVFARLAEHGDRYDLAREPEVLLFRMARNRCVDVQRRRLRESRRWPESRPVAAPVDDAGLALREALDSLPAGEREALLLTAVDGLGYREVATILGCSLGTVAALRCRAIEAMRRRMSP